MKAPSLNLYSAYLQTVCLVKNVFVNPHDIQALSWLHYSDIRCLLLSLQFWVDSNAGAGNEHGVTIKDDLGTNAIISCDNEPALTGHNRPKRTEEQSKDSPCDVTLNSNNYSCNPMQQLCEKEPVGQETSSGTQITNENTRNSMKACEFEKPCYTQKTSSDALVLEKDENISPKKNEIQMHNLCLESLLGLRNIDNNGARVLEILKAKVQTNLQS